MNIIKGKWHIISIWGVPVYLHWSIILLPILVSYIIYTRDSDLNEILGLTTIILMLLFSVLAHELGHALVAIRNKIIPKEIIFSPIGGLTRIKADELNGWNEIKIAFAGPLVNLLLAAPTFLVLYFFLDSRLNFEPRSPLDIQNSIGLAYIFLFINLALSLLNLVPAYPMDGGRVVRAVLSFFIKGDKATYIAILITFIVSTGIFVLAYYWSWYLLLIFALVIYAYALIEFYSMRWGRMA